MMKDLTVPIEVDGVTITPLLEILAIIHCERGIEWIRKDVSRSIHFYAYRLNNERGFERFIEIYENYDIRLYEGSAAYHNGGAYRDRIQNCLKVYLKLIEWNCIEDLHLQLI
jgi:hypothetical protein